MIRKFFCFVRRQTSGNAGRDCHPQGGNLKIAIRIFVKKVRILSKMYRQLEKEVAGSPEAKARQPILKQKFNFFVFVLRCKTPEAGFSKLNLKL